MTIRTHQEIDHSLCGAPVDLASGKSVVAMTTTQSMAVDGSGLVHGGFVFGMADYAAMLAVNDPNVVLGSSEMRFSKPVRVGETIRATAAVTEEAGRKRTVDVRVTRNEIEVASGIFICFVLDAHVLA